MRCAILLAGLVIAYMAVLAVRVFRARTEGFAGPSPDMQIASRNARVGLETAAVITLPASAGITPAEIEATAVTQDPLLPGDSALAADWGANVPNSVANNFELGGDLTAKEAACQGIRTPLQLQKSRPNSAKFGCGWLFKPDAPNYGFCAYGHKAAPANLKPIGEGFQWLWDTAEAVKAYEIAVADSVTDCSMLGFASGRGVRLGWCSSLGRAIPLTADNQSAYPSEFRCTGTIHLTADACAAAEAAASAGRTKSGTGATGATGPSNICSGDILSTGCRSSLADFAGCKNGTLKSHVLAGGGVNPAARYLVNQFSIHENVFTDGRMTVDRALDDMLKMAGASNSASDPGIQSAAANLCKGSPFDPCTALGPNEPITAACAQQLFQGAGCSQQGTAYPTAANLPQMSKTSYGALVKSMFSGVFDAAQPVTERQQALAKCMGVNVAPQPPPDCKYPGLELFYRHYALGDAMSVATMPLIKREIVKGWEDFATTGRGVPPINAPFNYLIMLQWLGYLKPTFDGTVRLRVTTDDGVRIATTDENNVTTVVLNKWYPMAPSTFVSEPIQFKKDRPIGIRIESYNLYGGHMCKIVVLGPQQGQGQGQEQQIADGWAFLRQQPRAPMLRWEFHEQALDERRKLVVTRMANTSSPQWWKPDGAPAGDIGLRTNGSSWPYWESPGDLAAISSVTLRVFAEGVQKNATALFGLHASKQGALDTEGQAGPLFVLARSRQAGDGANAWRLLHVAQPGEAPSVNLLVPDLVDSGAWTHVGVSIDRAAQRVFVYKNGALVSSGAFTRPIAGLVQYFRFGQATAYDRPSAFVGSFNYVHVFDYAMSAADMRADMKGEWAYADKHRWSAPW
jgi:hypothetical protein